MISSNGSTNLLIVTIQPSNFSAQPFSTMTTILGLDQNVPPFRIIFPMSATTWGTPGWTNPHPFLLKSRCTLVESQFGQVKNPKTHKYSKKTY